VKEPQGFSGHFPGHPGSAVSSYPYPQHLHRTGQTLHTHMVLWAALSPALTASPRVFQADVFFSQRRQTTEGCKVKRTLTKILLITKIVLVDSQNYFSKK